jgi:5'-nucleotidase
VSCKDHLKLTEVESTRIEINDSLPNQNEIEAFIAPFKRHIDSSLNAPLCFSPKVFTKKDGELNTAIGNMMADAIMELAGPVFKSRTGYKLDFVLLNHGGIRSVIPQGDINTRTAYQIMPFENEVVVVGLKGEQLTPLINYLTRAKRAHPISKELEIQLNESYELVTVTIHGEPIDKNRLYYIATNDFLYDGGDNMNFFQPNDYYSSLDYKVRNVLIDYFKKVDTLQIEIDKRFIRIGK